MSASTGCSPVGQSSGSGMSMFRWLEVLEKEFDKAFVDVDLLLGEIDPDQVDITYEGRQKMTTLSSCFAQLCHKAQTVFQLNHKLEVRRAGYHLPTDLQTVYVTVFTHVYVYHLSTPVCRYLCCHVCRYLRLYVYQSIYVCICARHLHV